MHEHQIGNKDENNVIYGTLEVKLDGAHRRLAKERMDYLDG